MGDFVPSAEIMLKIIKKSINARSITLHLGTVTNVAQS